METAEVNKKKRVKHCYPRKEIYHRFIHDDTLVYNNNSYACYGVHDYLFLGKCYNPKRLIEQTKEEFLNSYCYCRDNLISVIDREHKRIIINTRFDKHYWDLKRAVPSDFKIFYTNTEIPSLKIFEENNRETLLKVHATYLLEQYTRTLIPYYTVINSKSHSCCYESKFVYDEHYVNYDNLIDFIKRYKLRKYDWFKTNLNKSIKVSYTRQCWKTETLDCPTFSKVYNKTVFTKAQLLYIDQCYFYTKWCYGNGIPFNDVIKYWDKQVTLEEIVCYLRKHSNYCQFDNIVESQLWTDYIKEAIEAERAYLQNQEKADIAQSDKNIEEALNKCKELAKSLTVEEWREGKSFNNNRQVVEYRHFTPSYSIKKRGTWSIRTMNVYNKGFNNVQLKLINNNIVTSKHASVSLEEGIKMYRMFIKARINSNKTFWNSSDFDNIKVGIYNLRFIRYTDKRTDAGIDLHKRDWLIQIGCHSIWLEEVEDFIKYYHLEDRFHFTNIKLKLENNERN